MIKILFLDRDGVINREIGDYITQEQDFELNPDVIPFLKKALSENYKLVVITNQGGIDKGLYNAFTLNSIHTKMTQLLEKEGISILDIFYCPHHPNFTGKCLCRKPGSLMVQKALKIYNANPENCLMIGDRDRDAFAAADANVKALVIPSNEIPDWVYFQSNAKLYSI